MNVSLTPYNTDAFLNSSCTWRPLLPDRIPACQMTLPSQTINVVSRHVRGFWHRLWTRFRRSVVQRISAPRLRFCQLSLPSAESLQSAAQASRRAQRTQHNVGFVKKCDRQAVRVFVYPQHAQPTVQSKSLHFHTHSQVQSTLAMHRFAFRLFAIATPKILISKILSLSASNPCYYDSVSNNISYPELVENFIHPEIGLRYLQIVSLNRSERTD